MRLGNAAHNYGSGNEGNILRQRIAENDVADSRDAGVRQHRGELKNVTRNGINGVHAFDYTDIGSGDRNIERVRNGIYSELPSVWQSEANCGSC